MLRIFAIILIFIIIFIQNSLLLLQTNNNSQCSSLLLSSCDSGECIDSLKFCNGIADCQDQSDETILKCEGYLCSKNFFQCNYGGCIEISKKCDGKLDCIDGSDEAMCTFYEHSLKNLTIVKKRHAACESDLQAQCENGECISRFEFCDGYPNCSDDSDEISETCLDKIPCRNGFKCKYGACISKKKLCDGKYDCADKSDETVEYAGCKFVARISPVLVQPLPNPKYDTPSTCIVPDIKNLVMYRTREGSNRMENLAPGDIVESSINGIYYLCENRYLLRENNDLPDNYTNYCIGGSWTKRHPTCTKLCSSVDLNGISFMATCDGVKNDCMRKKYHLPGTIAKITCKYNYEEPDLFRSSILCEEDGNWNHSPHRCEPKCGILGDVLIPYVAGGQLTEIYQVPWHAAIFFETNEIDEYKNICGGTIINPRLILSAAHCFWNRTRPHNDKLVEHTKYRIVVGTTARNFIDRNIESQTFSVTKIIPHENFQGEEHIYLYDIALVVLNSSISFDNYATPICIDKKTHSKISTGVNGIIAGWGEIGLNKYPNSLQSIELLSLSYDDCKSKAVQHLAPDKFCLDTKNSSGSHVCYGDSGGGFVQLKNIQNDHRYVLRGVLSTGYHTISCGDNVVAGFTDIYTHDYVKFIEFNDNIYNPK